MDSVSISPALTLKLSVGYHAMVEQVIANVSTK